jgi:mono/diheme cytochrome c family protein
MFRTLLSWVGIALLGVGSLQGASQQQTPASGSSGTAASPHRALLDRYCVTCHNERLRTAELTLDKLDVANIAQNPVIWEKVVRKLRSGAMPPAGLPRPDKAGYDSLATYLETSLDRAAAANLNPGRPAPQRLNRTAYANAIRDLLALEIDGEALLPPDESTEGFDNIGDVLSISPLLLERYLSAGRKIARLAVGDPGAGVNFETYDVPKYLMQGDRMSEDLPFGSRGGVAIRHYFPLDGEYTVRILLQKDTRDYIRGLAEPHPLDVRLDGARIKLFTVGGEKHGRSTPIFSSANQGDPAQEEYERSGAEAGLAVRFRTTAGTHVVAVTFPKETSVFEGPLGPFPPTLTQIDFAQYKGGLPGIGSVVIGGPYNAAGPGETPSRKKIFSCRPTGSADAEPCAVRILSTLARAAYRRPVTPGEVEALLGFYRANRGAGDFDAGIEAALERILVGPEFLFRIERDPSNVAPNTAYRVSDIELASRLSFFLWSSIPDEPLLALAERGQIKDRAVLEQQVRRMLADPRSKALATNFGDQWLYIRNLRGMVPDPESFPYFDDNLKQAFETETELFFESILREDRSVMDLLNADYTFVNERLARHYGIPNIYGSHFRRVKLSDENRRGLLGQGSILMVTSYANRTSPVLRGKWVLDTILGSPPPPPPPNVPSLREQTKSGRVLTMRERMEQHRANPVCAGCHSRMDPLGFALENFDGIGNWRTAEGGTPIDPSGKLPDGTPFAGPAELRKILMTKREEFVTTVTVRLLTYGLGRGLEYSDLPVVRQVMREAAPSEYRWSSLILGIVNSTPFQMRRSQQP